MNTPVELIFDKFDELDSTVEFINWLLENEHKLLKSENDIIVKAFDSGTQAFFENIASDGVQYYENTFYHK